MSKLLLSPVLGGSLLTAADRIKRYRDALAELKEITGIDHVLGWTRLGGLSDQLITAHMERMRDQVMPALR